MNDTSANGQAVGLKAVDRVVVRVLVDNVSDLLATVPAGVTPELPNLMKAGAQFPLTKASSSLRPALTPESSMY